MKKVMKGIKPTNSCWDLEVERATEEFFRTYMGLYSFSPDDIHRRLMQSYGICVADQVFINIQYYLNKKQW